MRIGELARRCGVSRDTIRFYEKNGLVSSVAGNNSTNNYRDYPEDNVLTLDLVQQAKSAGLTLEDLIIFMQQLENTYHDGFDGEAFLEGKIFEVESRIEQSSKFLETLKATLAALKAAPLEDHFE